MGIGRELLSGQGDKRQEGRGKKAGTRGHAGARRRLLREGGRS